MNKVAACLFTIVIFITFGPLAGADEITLENGDRLTGTVVSVGQGLLILKTDYSDPIKINKSKITGIVTDNPHEIHLKDGEIVRGTISSGKSGSIVVSASAGRDETVVQWDNVSAVNPEPLKWKGNVNVGAGMQTGNTERTNASVGAEAVRRSGQDRFSLRFLFNYAEDEDEITARNTFGAGKYDYFFSKQWYGYVGVELLNDKFKNLHLRTVVGPGLGYQVWEDPIKSLQIEAGMSYFSEDLVDGEDDQWLTARFAGKLRYNVKNLFAFTDYLVVYPSLESFEEYQLRNEAALSTFLGSNWSFRLANILERNSDPPVGVEKNDWQWILGLQYSFGL